MLIVTNDSKGVGKAIGALARVAMLTILMATTVGCTYLRVYDGSEARWADEEKGRLHGIPLNVCIGEITHRKIITKGRKTTKVVEETTCPVKTVDVNVWSVPFFGGKLLVKLKDGQLTELDTTRDSQAKDLGDLLKVLGAGAVSGAAEAIVSE